MTPRQDNTTSVTDEQMSELLALTGTGTNEEADALKRAMESYRTETLLWAERRSAAMPSLAPKARQARLWAAVPQWSLAAIAAISIAAGLIHSNGGSPEAAAVDTPAALSQEASAASQQIADDNELLDSIDAAVNAGTGLPANVFGVDAVPNGQATRGSTE